MAVLGKTPAPPRAPCAASPRCCARVTVLWHVAVCLWGGGPVDARQSPRVRARCDMPAASALQHHNAIMPQHHAPVKHQRVRCGRRVGQVWRRRVRRTPSRAGVGRSCTDRSPESLCRTARGKPARLRCTLPLQAAAPATAAAATAPVGAHHPRHGRRPAARGGRDAARALLTQRLQPQDLVPEGSLRQPRRGRRPGGGVTKRWRRSCAPPPGPCAPRPGERSA